MRETGRVARASGPVWNRRARPRANQPTPLVTDVRQAGQVSDAAPRPRYRGTAVWIRVADPFRQR